MTKAVRTMIRPSIPPRSQPQIPPAAVKMLWILIQKGLVNMRAAASFMGLGIRKATCDNTVTGGLRSEAWCGS